MYSDLVANNDDYGIPLPFINPSCDWFEDVICIIV